MNMGRILELLRLYFVFTWLAFLIDWRKGYCKLAWHDRELHCVAFGSCIEQGVYMNGWLAV
jgi:hypothetical protein